MFLEKAISIRYKTCPEYVRLKARPMGRCSKAKLYVIASHHASFNQEPACFTSMDGGYENFARAKICQSNALIMAFEQRRNL